MVTSLFITWDWWERNTTPGHLMFHGQPLSVELICSQVAVGHRLLCYSMWESWGIRSIAATGTDFISGFKYPGCWLQHYSTWALSAVKFLHKLGYAKYRNINVIDYVSSTLILPLCSDPARVINMPPVIYVPRKLPGIIRCPVDANPPVTSVKWEKDGYPLRVEKVSLCYSIIYLTLHYLTSVTLTLAEIVLVFKSMICFFTVWNGLV